MRLPMLRRLCAGFVVLLPRGSFWAPGGEA